jgi:hypothetical protein
MMQPLLRHGLGMSFCTALLLAGCNQAQRQPAYARNAMGSVAIMPGYNPGTVFTTSVPTETVSAKPAEPLPQAPATETPVAAEKKMPEELPPTTLTASPPKHESEEVKHADAKLVDQQEALPASYAIPLTGGKEESIRRRSYADITAKPCFSHAPDYSWVQGELQYLHTRHTWRIRYASVDDDDVYGGAMNLVESGPMDTFKDGQLVRVQGRPDSPDAKETSFRVASIHVLNDQ